MMPLVEAWLTQEFVEQTLLFLSLVMGSLGIALVLGIPLGILLTGTRRLSSPVIATLGLLQTFPSLALLGLVISVIPVGEPAAIFLAALYSLFPIVLNTFVGITQVPPAVRDAARGMGMSPRQVLWNIDLPLGLPVVLAGVRTGAVYAVGIVTICALAGAGGLGWYIVRGMTRSDNLLIAIGAIPVLLITLLLFWGLGGIAWLARKNSHVGLLLGGGLIVILAGHGAWVVGKQFATDRDRTGSVAVLRAGSKNFVEGEILTEILKQMLEAHTDLRIEVVSQLAPNVIFKAIKTGQIDLYPEYSGNLLTNKEALDMSVPADRSKIPAIVREGMLKKHGLVVLEAFGLNNNYVFCAPRPLAEKHGLKKISDLRRLPGLRIVVDLDFLDRPDGWRGLVKTYDLDLPKPQQLSPDLRYRALQNNAVDIVLGFGTDWEIEAYDLVVLEDDRGYFPDYHGAPLVREDVLKLHPEIAAVLNRLKNQIDDGAMRQLNGQVARERRPESVVAREFLTKKGLLTK